MAAERGERQQRIAARAQQGQRRFTEPLTGKRAQHVAKAETNLAYGETQRQNQGLIRGSRQREKQVGDWYKTFANEIAASRGEVAGAYGQAGQQIAGTMQNAASDDATRQAALAAQNAQFSKLTGAPQNTASPQTDAAAQGQRELYGAALAAPVSTQGANAFAYLTNQGNVAKGEGLNQKIKQGLKTREYQQDRKALLKEKGNYRTTKLDELRKAERDYQIQLRATHLEGQKFGAEQAGAAGAAAQQATENRFKEQELGQGAAKIRNEGKKIRKEGKGGGKTPKEIRETREGRRNALSTVHSYIGAHGYPKNESAKSELEHIVAKESEVSPADAAWAVNRYLKRHPKPASPAQGEIHR